MKMFRKCHHRTASLLHAWSRENNSDGTILISRRTALLHQTSVRGFGKNRSTQDQTLGIQDLLENWRFIQTEIRTNLNFVATSPSHKFQSSSYKNTGFGRKKKTNRRGLEISLTDETSSKIPKKTIYKNLLPCILA